MESHRVIKIKWNKNIYSIDITNFKNLSELTNEISKLSSVLPNEQKLVYKSKVLKDDNQLLSIPDKATISMLGAKPKDLSSQAKQEKVTFLEDLTEEQKLQLLREKGEEIVFGLKNLGNTCYLNSTVQALGRIPELRDALKKFATQQSNNTELPYQFTLSLGQTYNLLDKATDAVIPMNLVNNIRQLNPLFAENEQGVYKQQDADECVSLLLNTVKKFLPNKEEDSYSKILIDELFGIEMNIQLKCVESESEIKTKKEVVYKLICYIDNSTIELVEGLKKSLKENIEMFSDSLQRNSFFEKTQYINRLPNYLNVQFMRFFWKSANTATGAKAGKAKILKSVLFSKIIDLYDMCTDETKEILNLGRKIENKLLKDDKNFKVENVKKEEGKNYVPTGRYQLISVITHQGRSSESGHYIGWVHKKDDKWLKYDDDKVSMVLTNDILELKGGGDWHMAYICFFKQLEVPFVELTE